MRKKKLGPYATQKAKGESLPNLKTSWPKEQEKHVLWDAICPENAFAPLPDTIKAFRKFRKLGK